MGTFSEVMEDALEEKDKVIRERDERIKRLEQRIEQQRAANRGMARSMVELSHLRQGLQKLIDVAHSEGYATVWTQDLVELLASTDNKSEGGEKGVNPPPLPSGGCTGASEPPG